MVHRISGLQIFPSDNVWNRSVAELPIHTSSNSYIAAMGGAATSPAMHVNAILANGTGSQGIPINFVTNATPTYSTAALSMTYASISDAGPYPIPANPLVEDKTTAFSDLHYIAFNTDTGVLYELTLLQGSGVSFTADSGAVWNLTSNAQHASGFTGANSAGMSSLVGLATYDEITQGAILHALSFSAPVTSHTFVWPATHSDGVLGNGVAPTGSRFRLKAGVDISGFSTINQIILTALKTYGAMLIDQVGGGSTVFFRGVPDIRWNTFDLGQMGNFLTWNDFEVVDTTEMFIATNTMQTNLVSRALFPALKRRGQNISAYNAGVLSDTPALYYAMNETSGGTAIDALNLHDGVLSNDGVGNLTGITIGQSSPLPYELNDYSYTFTGTGYILADAGFKTDGWTQIAVEFWINFPSLIGSPVLISNDNPAVTHNGIEISLNAVDHHVYFTLGNGTISVQTHETAITRAGTWYYVVCKYDGSTLGIYVNGQLASSLVAITGSIGTAAQQLNIGRFSAFGSNLLTASMSKLALYKNSNALTQKKMRAHYESRLTGTSYAVFPALKRRGIS